MSVSTQTETPVSPRSRRLRLVIFGLVVLGLAAAGLFFHNQIGEWLTHFRVWVQDQGAWGAVLYGLVYVACTVLFVPGSILTLGAGALYGPFWGTVIVWISANIGAALAFLIGRHVARDQVRRWVQGNARFAAVDAAIARRGGWIVFLLRLSPAFPFNLLNYALGLTGVSFTSYLLASLAGMLPGIIAYVFVGYAGQQTLQGGQKVLYWVIAAVVTLAATFFLTRVAARAIREAILNAGRTGPQA